MASPKTEVFSSDSIALAKLAKALGHPARIEIIRMLLKLNACVCGTLVNALPLSQATVSQHLKALKQAGLVQGTIDGPSICYCIDEDGWEKAQSLLGQLLNQNPNSSSCC